MFTKELYMNQEERRRYLTDYLIAEGNYRKKVPKDEFAQKRLLRALFNMWICIV